MAKLINGNGNPAVYANEDSDLLAAIMGNQTSITAIGEQFRADQADANTIEVFDGVIITKEGRRIQLDANQVDLFEIPTGTQGQTNYYIIGYHLYTDTDANQFCEVFVQLMESASDTIPEDTFRGGADDVYISLYRVTQDGLNIDSIDLLLPTMSTISEINSILNDLRGKTMIPAFDFKHPVKTLAASDNYTAQDGDYLYLGGLWGSGSNGFTGKIFIDGLQVAVAFRASYGASVPALQYQKLAAGQVITTSSDLQGFSYILREISD